VAEGLFISPSVEVLKPGSLLIKLSPRTRGPKNYLGPRVLTSYFYFYVRFQAVTIVVDGGSIFEIWRVGEEIWVRFFWAKGLGGGGRRGALCTRFTLVKLKTIRKRKVVNGGIKKQMGRTFFFLNQ